MDRPFFKIHFNALPEASRQRLVAAFAGQTEPRPILSQPTGGTGGAVGLFILAALILLAAAFIPSIDYGYMYHPKQGAGYLVIFMVLLWLAGVSIVAGIRRMVMNKATPFKRGRFLFPTDIVIATGPELTVYPLSNMLRLDPVHNYQNGAYLNTAFHFDFAGGKRESFYVFGKPQAEGVLHQIDQSLFAYKDSMQRQDWATVGQLDVLYEARQVGLLVPGSSPPAPTKVQSGPSARNLPVVLRWASLTAIALAIVAVPVWAVRNSMSQEKAYQNVIACGSVSCFETYLYNPTAPHADEVRNERLPAAAFREAQATGTVQALRDFVVRYPNARQVPEARQVIHARFEQVRATFNAQASTADPTMPGFMGNLLTWLEEHDSPPVQVRFLAPSSEALSVIDSALEPNTSPISPHFTPAVCEPRERYITEVLQRGFAAVFPNDVMRLEHFGRTTLQAPPDTAHGTIDVAYTVRPSGTTYVDDVTGRQFVGIYNDFVVRMSIPGTTQTHNFLLGVEPPQTFSVSYDNSFGGAMGPSDGAVYSTMAQRAFEQLGQALPQHFFRPESPAYQQATGRGAAGGYNPPPSSPPLPQLPSYTPPTPTPSTPSTPSRPSTPTPPRPAPSASTPAPATSPSGYPTTMPTSLPGGTRPNPF